MVEEIKKIVKDTVDNWETKINDKGGQMIFDVIKEISALYGKIMLKCAIGESLENSKVDFFVNGENRPRNVANSIRDVLG